MKSASSYLLDWALTPIALVKLLARSCRLWWEFRMVRRLDPAIRLCGEPLSRDLARQRVLVVITHIVSEEAAGGGPGCEEKAQRLIRTLNTALMSFAHCDVGFVVNTCPRRHVVAALPDYLRKRITVMEQDYDPEYVEFLVPDIFWERREDFDWFLFLEDDIQVYDSYTLEKLALFNRATGDPSVLLTPHLFEMYEGEEYYVNLLWPQFRESRECAWNRFATFTVDGIKFGECNRPHAAFYCLNREQLELWQQSGRRWKNGVVTIGPIESAATYWLYEVFTLYKPHRENMHFFEVEHWDTKYARIVAGNRDK
jgi:hypothetical protein